VLSCAVVVRDKRDHDNAVVAVILSTCKHEVLSAVGCCGGKMYASRTGELTIIIMITEGTRTICFLMM